MKREFDESFAVSDSAERNDRDINQRVPIYDGCRSLALSILASEKKQSEFEIGMTATSSRLPSMGTRLNEGCEYRERLGPDAEAQTLLAYLSS